MNDEDVLNELRKAKGRLAPVDIAMLLNQLIRSGLTQSSFISYFKQAFPDIPLRVLIDLGSWNKLTNGDLKDTDINATLEPWLMIESVNSDESN